MIPDLPPSSDATGRLLGHSLRSWERLIVAYDGSAPAVRAARLAIEVARSAASRVWFVHVEQANTRLPEPRTDEESSSPSAAVARSMAALVHDASAVGVSAYALTLEGKPVEALLRVARDLDANAIFVGSRGLGGAARWVLGSVSSALVAAAHVPVTVVP